MASKKYGSALAGVVGVTAATALMHFTPLLEGTVLKGYRDPIGIVTYCMGETQGAVLGKTYTLDECMQVMEQSLIRHAKPILKCTPNITGLTLASAVLFGYNVGTNAYCNGTVARRFNAGDIAGGCAAMEWYKYAGKLDCSLPANTNTCGGLITRRKLERNLCEGKINVPQPAVE